MSRSICRIKSAVGRDSHWRARALQDLRARTGRDPQSDDNLKRWVFFVILGLDAEAGSSRISADYDDARPPGPRRRGHPELNPLLSSALAGLVDDIGPSNAALLLRLCGCDLSKAFPIFRAGGAGEIHRRLAQRLSQIRARARRRPMPDLSIVLSGASVTSVDPATGTFRGTIPAAGDHP